MQFQDVVGHKDIKTGLLNEVKSDRVSHAQLIAGPEGSGKLQLAIAFAQYLLCDNPSENDSCGECTHCRQAAKLQHPDIHFTFPVVLSKTNHVESSDDRLTEWREFLLQNKYINLEQWQSYLEEQGKNAVIGKVESQKIQKKLSLTSYSGKYKIMIVWLADKMNLTAANKLLKLIEEPPKNTILLLTTNEADRILPTIISRTQVLKVAALSEEEVETFLQNKFNLEADTAHTIAALSEGNLADAISMVSGDQKHHKYFELFVELMRSAYAARPVELMEISEKLASLEKEQQKNFVRYGLHIFRESIIFNYLKGKLTNLREEEKSFLDKFARFINNQNITELHKEFNDAHYHLDRNANSKILFSDLVIRLTKLIKKGVQ